MCKDQPCSESNVPLFQINYNRIDLAYYLKLVSICNCYLVDFSIYVLIGSTGFCIPVYTN